MTKNKKQKQRAKEREKKPYLKKKEVCLLFPNFKPASNQTKIQKFLNYFYNLKRTLKNK